ncbi:class I SAM-dependent methyltransferase [Alkalihalobacillus sp. 1P02AB]|uniref:class I SAM-dependent methyltransferase n=1 Tax=Alkalihalobacillus sp. 1P02AB TaxID=3132260 RepID=UPI0039A5338B
MKNIFTDNFEKYADTEMYDFLNEGNKKDFDVLLEWIKPGDKLLELACGTGRLTIPFAEKGFAITGIDLHEGMLEKAKTKAEAKGLSIPFYQQDCTMLSLPEMNQFTFMTGNSFQHFLTNEAQDKLLQSIAKHLETEGLFIFDTRNPLLSELAQPDIYDTSFTDHRGFDVKEHHIETYDDATQILHCETKRKLYKDGVFIRNEKDNISLRYVFPLEMKRLLRSFGFTILQAYGNWNKTPLTKESPQMIYICRKNG